MKKSILLILLAVGLLLCTACNNNDNPDDTSADTIDTPNDASAGISVDDTTAELPKSPPPQYSVPEGCLAPKDFSFKEMSLPAEGESLTYDPPIIMFEMQDGDVIRISGAKREGERLFLDVADAENADYVISGMMFLVTAEDEILLSLGSTMFIDPNNMYQYDPYDYYIMTWTSMGIPKDTVAQRVERERSIMLSTLGSDYDPSKNYFRMQYYNVMDKTEYIEKINPKTSMSADHIH